MSDGASALMGKHSGVRLQRRFPNLFVWHCLNHRLELAVNDAIDEITAVNHFKAFMYSLYCVYSQSPKNNEQLKNISEFTKFSMPQDWPHFGRKMGVQQLQNCLTRVQIVWVPLHSF